MLNEDFIEFDALTEKEIQEANLIPDGKYKAEVFDAFSKDKNGKQLLTNSGVPKFEVTFSVYDESGKKRPLKSLLTPAFMKLWKHFFDATGQKDAYNARRINISNVRDCNKQFMIVLGKRTYKNQSNEDVTVNNIIDFLPLTKTEEVQGFSDDIPF